jgi:hypothetical protein
VRFIESTYYWISVLVHRQPAIAAQVRVLFLADLRHYATGQYSRVRRGRRRGALPGLEKAADKADGKNPQLILPYHSFARG